MGKREFGVIGLGYVGLPLAMEFAKSGRGVVGIDVSPERVRQIGQGVSYIPDVASEDLAAAVRSEQLVAATDYAALRDVDAISICVPTPLGKSRDPDCSYVASAAGNLSEVLRPGQTVILESTVYPGATEDLVAPVLERSGLKAGADFYLAFSPERIDPGRKYPLPEIPKVVGGINEASTKRAVEVYSRVFGNVVPVASTREAEMAKLLENTFRAVNIGLVNELAIVAHGMGINIWNVIDAASTKPFGYMPFYPGPGWGGHCIPVDPYYLSWTARAEGLETGFIDHAGKINARMPGYVVERVSELLNQKHKCLRDARVLLVGVAYKRDVSDIRESPAIDIAKLLLQRGTTVAYHDPHVPEFYINGRVLTSETLTPEELEKQDCVLILTDHRAVDYRLIADHSSLVFDTRNATAKVRDGRPNVTVL